MKSNRNTHFFMVFAIFFSMTACNSGNNQTEEKNDHSTMDPIEKTSSAEVKIDAVIAAPNLYKVLSDTLGLRVVEATYKPGDSSVMHTHPVNAMYVVEGGMVDFIDKEGKKMSAELKAGMAGVRGFDMHSVKNTGNTNLKVILMECTRPDKIVKPDATTDATKVSPDHYKTLHDSLGIRIVEVDYKPGESSVFHTHPDNAAYVLKGGTGELTDKDGKKTTNEIKSGMAWISPADGHSGKNVGKNIYKLILFEVNRARD